MATIAPAVISFQAEAVQFSRRTKRRLLLGAIGRLRRPIIAKNAVAAQAADNKDHRNVRAAKDFVFAVAPWWLPDFLGTGSHQPADDRFYSNLDGGPSDKTISKKLPPA
jgi:hypothetical protein